MLDVIMWFVVKLWISK